MSLVLYGAPLSPFVRKVDAAIREKGVPHELESVNIMPMPDWFAEISPSRRIPVLRDTDVGQEGRAGTIPDSSAICAYLERKHPEPALYPSDPFAHARALWIEEFSDSDMMPLIGMGIFRPIQFARFQGKDPDVSTARQTYQEKLPRCFDYLEGELDGREYFVDDFSIADIAVATALTQLVLVAGPLDASAWPRVAAHYDRVTSRPSLRPCLEICGKIVKQDTIDLSA